MILESPNYLKINEKKTHIQTIFYIGHTSHKLIRVGGVT